MDCVTVKVGKYCSFMIKSSCSYAGGICAPIVAQCEGCQRVVKVESGQYCTSYPNPKIKWRTGDCNFATHIKVAAKISVKMNPLKASKKSAKKK